MKEAGSAEGDEDLRTSIISTTTAANNTSKNSSRSDQVRNIDTTGPSSPKKIKSTTLSSDNHGRQAQIEKNVSDPCPATNSSTTLSYSNSKKVTPCVVLKDMVLDSKNAAAEGKYTNNQQNGKQDNKMVRGTKSKSRQQQLKRTTRKGEKEHTITSTTKLSNNHEVTTRISSQHRRGKNSPKKRQSPVKRASAAANLNSSSSRKKRQKSRNDHSHGLVTKNYEIGRTKDVVIKSTISSPDHQIPGAPVQSHIPHQKRPSSKRVLPPIVLNNHNDQGAYEALQHLPSNYKVEIFNRKNGRILSGKDAVALRDLPSILRLHSEYEPLIPSSFRHFDSSSVDRKDTQSNEKAHENPLMSSALLLRKNEEEQILYREARSSSNTHVNSSVQPQVRVRASAAEGRRVMVTAGPYRGCVGRIESCIPGNWYLVSDLSKRNKFSLDFIVHSNNLEILHDDADSTSMKSTKEKEGKKQSHTKITLLLKENLKMIRLQISSLETEKNDLKTAIMTGKTSKELLQSSSPFSTELERVEKKLKYAMKTLESKMLSLQMLEGNVNTIMGN